MQMSITLNGERWLNMGESAAYIGKSRTALRSNLMAYNEKAKELKLPPIKKKKKGNMHFIKQTDLDKLNQLEDVPTEA